MERTASETRRIAVLTGGRGRGSNLRAIHDRFQSSGSPVQIALVVGDSMDSPVRQLCDQLCLNFVSVSSKDMRNYEACLLELLRQHRIELVALAGFLKLLSEDFLSVLDIPVLNIHPALIPKYCGAGMYGMKVHQAVFDASEVISGATVHLVDSIYDHGQIIAQQEVDISGCTSPEEVAALVLKIEHNIYAPAILKALDAMSR